MSGRVAGKSSRTPDEALIKVRRERKRTTDRAAQREHRRRQKLYVEELEAQLALVRGGSVNEQVAQLMRENERLQKELNKYRGFFNSVEDLIMDEWQQDNKNKNNNVTNSSDNVHNPRASNSHRPSPPTPQQPAEESSMPKTALSPDAVAKSNLDSADNSAQPCTTFPLPDIQFPPDIDHQAVMLTNGTTEISSETHSWTYMSPRGAIDWSTSAFDFDPLQHRQSYVELQPNAIMWNENASSVDGSNQSNLRDAALGPFVAAADGAEGLSPQTSMPLPLSFPDFFTQNLNELDPALIFAPQKQAAPFIHQLFPRILDPVNEEDQKIQVIVERARNQNIRLDSPTLADFLCDNPDNMLSVAIKHYLEPVRKTRRTIEFLATYWVLYLLFRWQINRDEESFYNVPTWLRPSVTQTRVQHPIATDLLAWPLIRDEVIMTSLKSTELSREILSDVGLNLEIDIPLNKVSLDHDLGFLHAAISDLNNWRLNEGFFRKHPLLRPLYESSFQHKS